MKNLIVFILFIFIADISFAASKDTTETKPSISIEKKLDKIIIAKVGNLKISANELLTGYENGPAFVKREENPLRKYLDFMIYEKLLTQYGYENKVDTSKDVKQLLNDIEGDMASEELYKDLIWNNISISKKEIEKAAGKQLIELEIKWIYSGSYDEIKRKYSLIKNGVGFDSLFSEQLKDGVKYDDRFINTTRYNLEKNNPDFASVVDSMQIGELSRPVKGPDGWYIIKVSDIWKSEITSESDRNKLYHDMQESLLKRKADSLSDAFVNRIMIKKKPTIKHGEFNILKVYIGRQVLSPDEFTKWALEEKAKIGNPDFNISKYFSYIDNVLVEIKGGGISLKDFLNWYDTRSPYIKFDKKSYNTFSLSLQQIVWRMVRDKLLTDLALSRGYNKRENVISQMKWWKDKVVYSKVKTNIAGTITIDDSKLKEYYSNNLRSYKDKNGKPKSFDDVKEDVRNDFYVYEFTKKIVNKVLSLKQKYSISVDEKEVNTLAVNNKEDLHAIDVYAVKKGGTFPRPAFPTIDYEWQFWQ